MGRSWRLGRFLDIDVYLHPTLFLIALMPGVAAGGSLAFLMIVAGFTSVLLHEYGHALAARRFGIGTERITLYPIGGVARLERMPRAPGAEMVIALAGPAVNLAILVAIGLVLWASVLPADSNSALLLGAVATINLILMLFNLIPAFPMDGGRVLRAALSGWLGRVRATRIAAGVGRTLAVMFGVYSLMNGEWLRVFLALFVFVAAGLEYAGVVREERRRKGDSGDDDGPDSWNSPPGYRWVNRGPGTWQLQPILIPTWPPESGHGSRR